MVPQPVEEPLVISVKALNPPAYSQGFKKPRTGFPAASKASLTSDTMDAAVGLEALFQNVSDKLPHSGRIAHTLSHQEKRSSHSKS